MHLFNHPKPLAKLKPVVMGWTGQENIGQSPDLIVNTFGNTMGLWAS